MSDKGTQRGWCVQDGTQTDATTLCSSSCQTVAAFADDVLEAGVLCKRSRKSFGQRSSADKHSDLQNAAELSLSGTRNSLQVRLETHPEKRLNRACHFCSQCYTDEASLAIHEREHTEEETKPLNVDDLKPYVCNVCQKRFSRTLLLVAHWKVHDEESLPHRCTVCEKSFSSKRGLVEHRRRHTVETYYFYCRFCHKRFSKVHSLDVHERTHTGEANSFVCRICHKRLSTKQHLVDHMLGHTGERPFGCSICPARFSHKHQLNYHLRAHAAGKARSYSCNTCEETFAVRCDFSTHMRQHAVPCSACEKTFPDKESLANHERRMHISAEDATYACIVCHKTFDQVSGLASHYCPLVDKRILAAAAETDALGDLL